MHSMKDLYTRRLPPWPALLPRVFRPLAPLGGDAPLAPHELTDVLAQQHARQLLRGRETLGGQTTTWTELMWVNTADFTAFNTSASEGSLLAGLNDQPFIPAFYFANKAGKGRGVSVLARGVLGTTSTPTISFQARLGTTSGSTFLSGTSVGVSAAITTSSGVSTKWWELRLDLICNTPGIGTGNTTLSGAGYVMSPGGFASPFVYALEPTTPESATWTSTVDCSVVQYLNLSVTWSASSASNTITCKQLLVYSLN